MTDINEEKTAPSLMCFADIKPIEHIEVKIEPWKVLVVDDEKDVHDMTRLVLSGFSFQGRKLLLSHAKSAIEAKGELTRNPDTALILLDVVMESDDAGLQLVRHIRETLENEYVRIILRTGQPGQAPEQKVIVDYDINDYKGKAELTAQKLITSIISALRSYNTIMTVARLNAELEEKVEQRTFQLQNLNRDLEDTLRKLQEDENAGRMIQFKMLPAETENFSGTVFRRMLAPSTQLSGDFVDYFRINAEQVGFYLADVSGHGVASAFVTVLLKSFISHYCDMYKTRGDNTILDPAALVERLNRELLREDLGKHLTIFYGVLDCRNGETTYVNGGHFPYPIIRMDGQVKTMSGSSPAVGLFSSAGYEMKNTTMEKGTQLLIFSDGILDILPCESLGEKLEYINTMIHERELDLDSLVREFDLDSDKPLPDDVTVLTVSR